MRILNSLFVLLEVGRLVAGKVKELFDTPDKRLEKEADGTKHVRELREEEWRKLYERYHSGNKTN